MFLAIKAALPLILQHITGHQTLASLFLDGGIHLWAKGWLESGRSLTEEAKSLCDNSRIEKLVESQVYSFHASVVAESGDFEEALRYFEKSLEIFENHLRSVRDNALDSERALLANAWNNLAGIHQALGNFNEAELYNKLLLDQEKKLDARGRPMSHLLCLSYCSMAAIYAG